MAFPRKWWAVLMALVLAAPVMAAEREGRLVVGFSQDTFANDWRYAQVQALQQELAGRPDIELMVTDGKGSTAQQIQDIEDLMARKVDILVASPRDSHAMTPVISRAYKQGIPVVLLTRRIETEDFTTFIAPDDAGIGRAAAEHIATSLKGRGKVLVLQGVPTASTAVLRTEFFLDEIKKYPGIKIVGIKPANYLRNDAIRVVEEAIQSGLAFDAIYAQSDSMASGARIALKGGGRDPRKVLIVGIDYIAEARDAIRRGEQNASFTYPTCAREAARVILDLSAGKVVPKQIRVPSRKVTREDVDTVRPIF